MKSVSHICTWLEDYQIKNFIRFNTMSWLITQENFIFSPYPFIWRITNGSRSSLLVNIIVRSYYSLRTFFYLRTLNLATLVIIIMEQFPMFDLISLIAVLLLPRMWTDLFISFFFNIYILKNNYHKVLEIILLINGSDFFFFGNRYVGHIITMALSPWNVFNLVYL